MRGPQGERGRDVYDLVRDSGYSGSEEEFADSLLGEDNPYERVTLLNGWTNSDDELVMKIEDGAVHLTGQPYVGDASAPMLRLPEEARPAQNMMRIVGNQSTSNDVVRLYFFADSGNVQVHGSYINRLGSNILIDLRWATRDQTTRPRIPGPQGRTGKSAYDYATEAGWDGSEEHLADMFAALGRFTPEQLRAFVEESDRTEGPQGPPGVSLDVDTSAGYKLSFDGRVIYYDSGWRELSRSEQGSNGWTDASKTWIQVRRTLDKVHFRGEYAFRNIGSTLGNVMGATHAGFTPDAPFPSASSVLFAGSSNKNTDFHFLGVDGRRYLVWHGSTEGSRPSDPVPFDISVSCTESLPTTLIGDSA